MDRPLIIVAMHGYGMTPEVMLRLTVPLVGPGHIVASMQGPFPHYVGELGTSAEVGYNWGVRSHHQEAIEVHHEMTLTVLDQLKQRFGQPPERCVLLGFSQPVGLNYRFIGTHPGQAGGVIGLCGGVPRNWEEDKYQRVSAPILHISRVEDEFFPADVAAGFPDRLRAHAREVEFHLLPGPHRFPSKATAIVGEWLGRTGGRGAGTMVIP